MMEPMPTARQMATDLSFTAAPSSHRSPKRLPREVRGRAAVSQHLNEQPPNIAFQSMESLIEIDLTARCGDQDDDDDADEEWNTFDNITALGLSFAEDETSAVPGSDKENPPRFALEDPDLSINARGNVPQRQQYFDKWMRLLHRKASQRRKAVGGDNMTNASDWEASSPLEDFRSFKHKKSSSGSSFGFVTAVKSASISLASISVAPRSRRLGTSLGNPVTERSSRTSNVGTRFSEDDSFLANAAINDIAVTQRSLQRRRVLEEMISTEEGYVSDIKFLNNVYSTLLASIPTLSLSLRSSINRNLMDIVELHEELLGDLHRAVPHSEYTQQSFNQTPVAKAKPKHQRWRSLDAVPEHAADLSWLQKVPGVVAEPSVAADVAKVFASKMHRFFVYEEYGAKYELLVKDVASTYRTIPQWDVYQKGLEALAVSLASINSQEGDQSKKSLTVGDLLVKPIQRVCRYPLLFAELLKQTPVCDCPESHKGIEKTLGRLRETTAAINRATDDPRAKALLEKTWLLQDRLVFPDQVETRSREVIRTLGQIQLCGVLYAVWQTRDGIDGQYLISLLYRDYLIFASAPKYEQAYTVQASIRLDTVRVEEIDVGRGLQCHTAPFSWKLAFECDHQLYEMILSACSPKEQMEWKAHLMDRTRIETVDSHDQMFLTSLSLGLKSMGTVFGKPGTIARRLSIHRATTLGPQTSVCQVIIKNTSALKEMTSSNSANNINRSQSLLTTNRTSVLSPLRTERIKLENLLSDVWTKDQIPYPGMTGRQRSDNIVRSSANSVMRKLSVASITSNLTKRSGSLASLASSYRSPEDDKEVASCTTSPFVDAQEDLLPEGSRCDMGSDSSITSRLSMITDEPLLEDTLPPLLRITHNHTPIVSPTGTLKRLMTLRAQQSWHAEGHRHPTPPLRASSANGVKRNHTPPSIEVPLKGRENQGRRSQSKWTNGIGLNNASLAEGIRGFFR